MRSRLTSSFTLMAMLIATCGCSSISAPPPAVPASSISISPTSVLVGTSGLVATVTTSNFPLTDDGPKFDLVVWSANGTDTPLGTTFVSATQLTVDIPDSLLSTPVTAKVRIELWRAGGDMPERTSPSVDFVVSTVASGFPHISSLTPVSAMAGSPDLTLTITGSNFISATHTLTRAVWSLNSNDTNLSTTFVSSTQLTAVIPAFLLANPGTASLRVEIWDKQGDAPESSSNLLAFTIN